MQLKKSVTIDKSTAIGQSSWTTLQFLSADTSIFLAARSLCTKAFPARYFIPEAT